LLQPLQETFASPLPQPAMPSGSGAIIVLAVGMTPIWESTVPLNCRSTCAEATHEIPRSVVRAQVKRVVDVCTVFKKAPERQIRNDEEDAGRVWPRNALQNKCRPTNCNRQ
jgi:hypothetical protein